MELILVMGVRVRPEVPLWPHSRNLQFAAFRRFLTEESDMESYAATADPLGLSPGSFQAGRAPVAQPFPRNPAHRGAVTQPEDSNPEEEIGHLARIFLRLRVAQL